MDFEQAIELAAEMRRARDEIKPFVRQAVMQGRVAVAYEEVRLNVRHVEYTSETVN